MGLGHRCFTVPTGVDSLADNPGMSTDLVATGEVARMLGISRQRVEQLAELEDDFPEPAPDQAFGPMWHELAIVQWAERHGHEILD